MFVLVFIKFVERNMKNVASWNSSEKMDSKRSKAHEKEKKREKV